MSTAVATSNGTQRHSLIETMAAKYNIEPVKFFETVKATIFDGKGTKEEMIAFLIVADQYDLNPFTKEIYAFPKKGGGVMPVVSVDGWANIVNSHPNFDGMEFTDHLDEKGQVVSITCRMYRKDRMHPTEATEYMGECKRNTDTWRQWPRRMLRHKAMIQAARYAFSLSGIADPDEAERMNTIDVTSAPSKVQESKLNQLLDKMPKTPSRPAVEQEDGPQFVADESQDSPGNPASLDEPPDDYREPGEEGPDEPPTKGRKPKDGLFEKSPNTGV